MALVAALTGHVYGQGEKLESRAQETENTDVWLDLQQTSAL